MTQRMELDEMDDEIKKKIRKSIESIPAKKINCLKNMNNIEDIIFLILSPLINVFSLMNPKCFKSSFVYIVIGFK